MTAAPPQSASGPSERGNLALRISVATLAAIGFVLSYDALRQMAVAVHIRGLLSYLFPLVIDGFIGIGVAALIILRTGPKGSRAYVWALVFIATGTSIWANALHAVRLNHLPARNGSLQLGDLPVALLSTVAPLALAGAVHLYILIGRHSHTNTPSAQGSADPTGTTVPAAKPSGEPTAIARPNPPVLISRTTSLNEPIGTAEAPTPADVDHPAQPHQPASGQARQRRTGRPPGADLEQLLDIARTAVEEAGKLSRSVVETAIRAHDLPLGGERLTEIMKILRAEADTPSAHPVS
ncbi:DUF2637 domain-containing protein [Streptomyces boninensis]|uniref:DUF2637 domain-containing protein n=1 Tax=Streptomyces boninensis TaxID=2039455 RepID=UPI003B20D650